MDTLRFKLWYTRNVKAKNRVSIIVDKTWKNNVVEVKRMGDQFFSLKMLFKQETFSIINAYVTTDKVRRMRKDEVLGRFRRASVRNPTVRKIFPRWRF